MKSEGSPLLPDSYVGHISIATEVCSYWVICSVYVDGIG
jgi:hypothetical protein